MAQAGERGRSNSVSTNTHFLSLTPSNTDILTSLAPRCPADKYQCCEVVGIDMQSFEDWGLMDHLNEASDRAGPKVTFTTMKPGVPLRFDEKFDFVHVRYLSFSADHDTIFKNAWENLNPGGWAEFHEWLLVVQSSNGFSKGRGAVLKEWSDMCVEGEWDNCRFAFPYVLAS